MMNVGIGEFKLDKSLNIIDFTDEKLSKYLNPFSDDFDINLYCYSIFIKSFIKDISKPISEDDSLPRIYSNSNYGRIYLVYRL